MFWRKILNQESKTCLFFVVQITYTYRQVCRYGYNSRVDLNQKLSRSYYRLTNQDVYRCRLPLQFPVPARVVRHRGGGELRRAPVQAHRKHATPHYVLHRCALLRLRFLHVRFTGTFILIF